MGRNPARAPATAAALRVVLVDGAAIWFVRAVSDAENDDADADRRSHRLATELRQRLRNG